MGEACLNLCFHGIGSPTRDLEDGEEPYWVERDTYLHVLDEVMTWPRVALSFDDGNASDVEIGLPALQERGLDATFFVLAGRLDQPGSLSRSAVRELRAAGMGIGSHGMDHRPWRGITAATRDRELIEAREVIAETIGAGVDEAACPLGRYDRRLLTDLRRLGYRRVHTSDRRPASPAAWLQPRYSMTADDTVHSLRERVLARQPMTVRARRTVVGIVKRMR